MDASVQLNSVLKVRTNHNSLQQSSRTFFMMYWTIPWWIVARFCTPAGASASSEKEGSLQLSLPAFDVTQALVVAVRER